MSSILQTSNKQTIHDIVCYAYKNSPFYKELYNQKKIDINNITSLNQLPIVSQMDLVKNSLKFKTTNNFFKICASSGTITQPKLMFRTEQDYEISVQNQIELMKWAGVKENDIVAIAQTFGIQGYGDLTQEATKRLKAQSLPIGMISDEASLKLIKDIQATILDISPSRLLRFLKLSEQYNFDDKLKLHTIMVAGEPLPIGLKELVMERWNCKLYNQYGSEETDALGGNYVYGGGIKLLNDSFIFEILDKNNKPIKNNDIGRLVITSLYHKGTPLIRYDLKDFIKQHPKRKEEFEILGRNNDYILIYDSITISPYQIEEVLISSINNIEQWQCIIEEKNNSIFITLNLQAKNITSHKLENIKNSISQCSIDIETLVSKGDIQFKVLSDSSLFIRTKRKTPRFIDKRKKSNE